MVKLRPVGSFPLARRDAGLADVTGAYNQTHRQRKLVVKCCLRGVCVVAVMHRLEALQILKAKLGSVERFRATQNFLKMRIFEKRSMQRRKHKPLPQSSTF